MRDAPRSLAPMALLLACPLVVSSGCGEELTELVVVVDSDLEVPEELDHIRIDIKGPGGDLKRADAWLRGEDAKPLPRATGVVHRSGELEPVEVNVVGSVDGTDVIQRRAETGFVRGEVRVLRMDLLARCLGVQCAFDETCGPNGCRDVRVGPEELEEWDGQADRLDASALDAGMDAPMDAATDACMPREEQCNGLDDDCDDAVDEDFDLSSDPLHCGACDVSCPSDPDHAASRCEGGDCLLSCDDGWKDCDGDDDDGCEALLISPESCGDCDVTCGDDTPFCAATDGGAECVASCEGDGVMACGGSCVDVSSNALHCGDCDNACPSRPNSEPLCSDGACGITCDDGWFDCNGLGGDGCESQLRETANCGSCGTSCTPPRATGSCTTGECVIVSCDPGFGDCNADAGDGCETDLTSDISSCGTCGNACPSDPPNASSVCTDGSCDIVCDDGWADCDGDPDNGCEADLSSTQTCGSCGIRCEGSTPLCTSDGMGGFTCSDLCGTDTECGDSCVDTDTNPSHCGECGNECPEQPNSAPTCTDGTCGIACDSGWDDCNGDPSDGCETSLTTTSDCGSCGSSCDLAHAAESCATGSCELTRCDDGWDDCNGDPSDGCETSLTTTSDCGSCGATCSLQHATATCDGGSCRIASCDAGWGNCDGLDGNGCETSLTTTSNCGSCGNSCPASAPNASGSVCRDRECALQCDEGWGDCDGSLSNGCETSLSSNDLHCGACGNDCGTGSTCCGGSCCANTRVCCVGVCCAAGDICTAADSCGSP